MADRRRCPRTRAPALIEAPRGYVLATLGGPALAPKGRTTTEELAALLGARALAGVVAVSGGYGSVEHLSRRISPSLNYIRSGVPASVILHEGDRVTFTAPRGVALWGFVKGPDWKPITVPAEIPPWPALPGKLAAYVPEMELGG